MSCFINILIFHVNPIDGKQYVVHVDQRDFDLIQQQSARFGLKYVRNVLPNMYLFEDVETDTNGDFSPKNIDDFKAYFQDKDSDSDMLYLIKTICTSKLIWSVTREEGDRDLYVGWLEIIAVEPVYRMLAMLRTQNHSKIRSRRLSSSGQSFRPNYGMDIQQAWSMGYTGKGVTVAVVDTGVNMNHPDLFDNSNKALSKNFVDKDKPQYSGRCKNYFEYDKETRHGTMVAGLIAAKYDNYSCTIGVAFDASLVGLKVNQPFCFNRAWHVDTSNIIAEAFKYERDRIDIYCYSINFRNNYVENLGVNDVLEKGAQQGREGKGSIFVTSAGNKYWKLYDCNLDSFTNSQYTISITSVGMYGSIPDFAIPCTCSLASTYGIYTTYTGESRLRTTGHYNSCSLFSGTSASAALASGIIALTLEANPKLTWRDIQHLIVNTSSLDGLNSTETIHNNNRLSHSPYFGFGLMNATAMVQRANTWRNVPRQHCASIQHKQTVCREDTTQILWNVSDENVKFLEHVTIHLRFETKCNECISMQLCSPAGTCVNIVHAKRGASSTKGSLDKLNWNYTTVSLWGESSQGEWNLTIKDAQTPDDRTRVHCAILNVYGTTVNPYANRSSSDEDDEGTNSYCGRQHKCGSETEEFCREMVHGDSDKSAGAAKTFPLICLLFLSLLFIAAN